MKIITEPLVTKKVTIETTFITQEGYYAVCIFQPMLHRCGYLGLPKRHPFQESEDFHLTQQLPVHGGITYEGVWGFFGLIPNDLYFIGFSCDHIGDKDDTVSGLQYGYKVQPKSTCVQPKSTGQHPFVEPTVKDLSFVMEQLRRLSKQITPHALMQKQMEIGS